MSESVHPRATLTGGAVFVVSDAATFVALLCGAASMRSQSLEWPAGDASVGLLLGLTVLLLSGSALLQVRRSSTLYGVALLGLAFVAGEASEWRALIHRGAGPASDLRHASLFVVTGLHGLHVLVGSLYALRLAVAKKTAGTVLSLYWAALDVAWLGIWLVVYR